MLIIFKNMNDIWESRSPLDWQKDPTREGICQSTRASLQLHHLAESPRTAEDQVAELYEAYTPEHALQNITALGDGTLKGETLLIKNTNWAKDFVHSSDLMPAVAILARELGSETDHFNIEKFRIYKRIKRQMTIYGKRGNSLGELTKKEEKPPSLIMELKIGNDVITIVGFQTGSFTSTQRFTNIILNDIVENFQDFNVSQEAIQFPVKASNILAQNKTLASQMPLGLRLAISIDLILSAIKQIPPDIMAKASADSSRIGLVGGFESFQIPQPQDLSGSGLIKVIMPPFNRIKNTKTNLLILPIEFEFQDIQGKSIGQGVVNMAMPKIK